MLPFWKYLQYWWTSARWWNCWNLYSVAYLCGVSAYHWIQPTFVLKSISFLSSGGVNSAYFIYAVQDCFEMIQPSNMNCILQYRPKQCCSFNQICDHDIANLKMCVINGSRYYEGERMRIPNKPCRHCICSDDFDMANVDSNHNCYEEKCLFEIHWNEFLLKGAAPVYTEGRCCPTSWRLRKWCRSRESTAYTAEPFHDM